MANCSKAQEEISSLLITLKVDLQKFLDGLQRLVSRRTLTTQIFEFVKK